MLSVTVRLRWRTVKTGRWDLVKDDHDRLIEVKLTLIRGNRFIRCRVIQVGL